MKKIIILALFLSSLCFSQWHKLNSGTNEYLTSLFFINDSTGWIGGNNGTILHTCNYGNTWSKHFSGTKNKIDALAFINVNEGYAIGYGGTCAYTKDGGKSWNQLSNSQSLYFVYNVNVVNKDLVWFSGGDWNFPALLSSKYGANYFTIYHTPSKASITTVACDSTGYIGFCDTGGNYYSSNDFGKTWTKIINVEYYVNKLLLSSNRLGIIVGSSPNVFISKDSGLNWAKKTTDIGDLNRFVDISIDSNNKLYAVINNSAGTISNLAYSSDEGISWKLEKSPVIFSKIQTTPGNIVYAVGDSGYIYRLNKTTNIKSPTLPNQFSLSQNYPNPFNPETTIEYSIPKPEHLTIKIFDVLGREVATIVDEFKQAGAYKADFNASGLTSGVYFYQLSAGSYVETKKLIILR